MVAADYTVSPTLIFQDNNMGTIGGAVGGVFGMLEGNVGGALSAYKKTPEGKVVVASMTDAFNNFGAGSQKLPSTGGHRPARHGHGRQTQGQLSRPEPSLGSEQH